MLYDIDRKWDPLADHRCYYCGTDAFWWGDGLRRDADNRLSCCDCRTLREAEDVLPIRSYATFRARKGVRQALGGRQYEAYYALYDFKEGQLHEPTYGPALGVGLSRTVNALVEDERLKHRRGTRLIAVPSPSFGDGTRDHVERIFAYAEATLTPDVQVAADLLRKTKDVQSKGHTRAERIAQHRDAYAAVSSKAIRGSTMIVCDDFYTTGSSVVGCARALMDAGARRVYGASIARVINPPTLGLITAAGAIGIWGELDDLRPRAVVQDDAKKILVRFSCSSCGRTAESKPLHLPAVAETRKHRQHCPCDATQVVRLAGARTPGGRYVISFDLDGRRPSELQFFFF